MYTTPAGHNLSPSTQHRYLDLFELPLLTDTLVNSHCLSVIVGRNIELRLELHVHKHFGDHATDKAIRP